MASKLNVWISAARLRTIPLSVSGVLIGSFSSLNDNKFNLSIFLLAILTTASYQILSNFANDYGDGVKGTDKKRIGPKRALQSGEIKENEMKNLVIISALVCFLLTIILVSISFKNNFINLALFIFLGILAIISAIKYTIGSNAYGYVGLGDVFVFIFFGLVSVLGSNFLFTSYFNFSLIYPACVIGFLSVGVLNLNNMRDIKNDFENKKNTLVVIIGLPKSKIYHSALLILSIILMLKFHFLIKIKSVLLTIFFILLVLALLFQAYKVYKVSHEKDFDLYLRPLVFSVFLYAIILSIHYLVFL
ncbi:MAG: 1,4-dihydroxy-2-naphthoate octaprenyltransferase [Flavobacteriaceae bacterium]|nr:1,4-dihydroxy-2-naphthoate octaprenyltransferase [Flavobacteriaceae bacterium]|tara:strand:+ start:8831 stop:9742 length:912 start_codon:yes stop_codon:yes gene_type:complete